MHFTKMQAYGNDFVVFGTPASTVLPKVELIKEICDRHYGIGADCAVFVQKSKKYDYFMHVYNPDGFEAEICGNALRCSVGYVLNNGYFTKKQFTVETLSGPRSIVADCNKIITEIGKARIIEKGNLHLSGITLPYVFVDLGNPHCVVFINSITDDEFCCFGKLIENHPNFPNGTNVEFVSFLNNDTAIMRVWERGIGETLSCTTGSCACVAAGIELGLCEKNVSVQQAGGIIKVETRNCGNIFVTGECKTVFKGTFKNI